MAAKKKKFNKEAIIKKLLKKKEDDVKFKFTKKYLREEYDLTPNQCTEVLEGIKTYFEEQDLIQQDDIPGLSHKEKIFCIEYLKSYNVKNSAARAGIPLNECYKLIKTKKIREGLKAIQTRREEDLYLEGINIIQMYMSIAFADITDYVEFGTEEVPVTDSYGRIMRDDDGEPRMQTRNYIRLKESSKIDGRLIQEVKQGRDGVSVKLFDKMEALNKLAKYMDVYNESTTNKLNMELLETRVKLEKKKLEVFGGDANDYKIVIERADK